MSAAFLILAHANPLHLSRLVSRLERQQGHIYIHLDGKARAEAFGPFDPARVTLVEPRTRVYWGDVSIVQATLAGMRQALEDSRFDHDYVVLLSGADYPVLPVEEIDSLFSRGNSAVYMNMVPMPSPGKSISRLKVYWFRGHWPRLMLKVLDRLSRKLPSQDPGRVFGGTLYAGDQWWALPREVAQHVLGVVDANPEIMSFLEHSRCPDEFLFQYIIGNSRFESRISGTLTYTRWKPGTNSPETIDGSDLDRLLRTPQDVLSADPRRPPGLPFAFARKFAAGGEHLLDRVDAFTRAGKGAP